MSIGGSESYYASKISNLCSEDERRSYGFGTTWGHETWVINEELKFLGELSL